MKKKNKVRNYVTNIKLYYKAKVIKTARYWFKNRHIAQWNKTESPEINLHLYGYLICDKGGKNIEWGKIVYSINGVENIGQIYVKKIKQDYLLIKYKEINTMD